MLPEPADGQDCIGGADEAAQPSRPPSGWCSSGLRTGLRQDDFLALLKFSATNPMVHGSRGASRQQGPFAAAGHPRRFELAEILDRTEPQPLLQARRRLILCRSRSSSAISCHDVKVEHAVRQLATVRKLTISLVPVSHDRSRVTAFEGIAPIRDDHQVVVEFEQLTEVILRVETHKLDEGAGTNSVSNTGLCRSIRRRQPREQAGLESLDVHLDEMDGGDVSQLLVQDDRAPRRRFAPQSTSPRPTWSLSPRSVRIPIAGRMRQTGRCPCW